MIGMQIRQESLLGFMGQNDVRFDIPVFQRVYSWNARQCEELWDDIMRIGLADDGETHFMGMLLYAVDAQGRGEIEQLDVIDGQQRLTTATLLLCALARYLEEGGCEVGGISADDLRSCYLRSGKGCSSVGKLVLSDMDRETLFALVGAGDMPEEPAGRLIENLELFHGRMVQPDFDIERLWRGLQRLEVASVLLAPEDSPQLVFESLNSKGMALSLADRLRNLVVVTDDGNPASEESLFETRWLPLERIVADAGIEGLDVTTALEAWLAGSHRGTRIFNRSEVYGVLKSHLRDACGNDLGRLLSDALAYVRQLIENDTMREEALENANRWTAGKPKDLISEYKMFGD
uniref:GmrSD restriction endonucleases N-terminal domain-containing protein n=1 Tax=uncultured bacterium Contig1491 TaxID=1393439 RepID=W0FJ47_9BACT|nr:hypothetical protein [uncultured bacterium Contig1491]